MEENQNVFTGKTKEEAIAEGLKALGITEEQAEITVLEEGKRKLFGSVKARVMVTKKASDGERASAFIDGLMKILKIPAFSDVVSDGEKIEIEVKTTNTSAVIGRRGEVLDAIQCIAGAVANIGRDEYRRVVVDCEGYRAQREEKLKAVALAKAAKAVERKRRVAMEPMSPYERRVVHSVLASNEDVTTISEGKEPMRRVVIIPKDELPYERREKRGGRPTVVVLGSGPIRIGQGIEFDYSSVHCVSTLRAMGYDVVIINNNPETVSTDYDTASRLYFEPLCPEDVMGVIAVEQPVGVVVAFGGQTAISLAQYLVDHGVKILGTSAEGIDLAEDREKFDALLESLGIKRPRGAAVHSLEEAIATAGELGYPVLLRPSYVIGGQNMVIAHDEAEVRRYMDVIITAGNGANVLIDQYLPGTELECDVISDGKRVLVPGIMEHIERAGIHSGDSIAVTPPYNLSEAMTARVLECSRSLALALGTEGLVNIQYLVYKDELYVIEVNPRASRTVPYLSKISGIHMADVATRVMMGETLESMGYPDGLAPEPGYVGIKVPVFSFEKVPNANSLLGPEMKSTGEVLGIGRNFEEALYKGLTAAGFKFVSADGEKRRGVLLSVETRQLGEIEPLVRRLYADGRHIFATPETAEAVKALGCYAFDIGAVTRATDIGGLLERAGIGLVIYTGALHDDTMGDYTELHLQAVKRGIPTLTSIDTALAAVSLLDDGWTEDATGLVDVSRISSGRQL